MKLTNGRVLMHIPSNKMFRIKQWIEVTNEFDSNVQSLQLLMEPVDAVIKTVGGVGFFADKFQVTRRRGAKFRAFFPAQVQKEFRELQDGDVLHE